jgi:hypothetical protein
MTERRVYDDELHTHYVAFSCYKKRRVPAHDRAKRIGLGVFDLPLTARDWFLEFRPTLPTRPVRKHPIQWLA